MAVLTKLNYVQKPKMNVRNSLVFYMNKIYGNKKCYSRRKRFRPTRLGNIYVLKGERETLRMRKCSRRKEGTSLIA